MCGIAGIVNSTGTVDADLLRQMIGAIRYRGPDDTSQYTDHHVGLAHARLSIIDLAAGAQPMRIADQPIWITFNGEIFNYIELRDELIQKGHRFATRSDTEVILRLYQEEGVRCVERLNGQWAFAIWDAPRQRLFLSRDRLGVRPLFYTQTVDRFLFASEIKALFACPGVERQLDLEALDQIFTFWVTLPTRTPFRNIQQLPPGHSLVLEDGRVNAWEYWRLNLAPEDDGAQDGEQRLTDELLALLLDATRIRLRSDVPVGAYLSGGLDSTFITALARQVAGDRLNTFSVCFEGTEFDESAYQQETTALMGTLHSSLHCSPQDIAESFSDVIWHVEQPILRTAPAPLFLLSRLVRNSGFKVVLTGEGADEIFGGYDIFKEAKIRRFWGRQPRSSWRPLLLKRLYPYMNGIQRQSPAYLKGFFHVAPEDLDSPFFSHMPRWRLTAKLKTFLSDAARAETRSYSALAELEQSLPSSHRNLVPFNQAEYLETRLLLPGYILSSQGDRVAMAHAVETRYPFLDYRVVEFAAKMPPRLKMKVLDEKYLLRRAAGGLIPEVIRQRHKQPYRAPEGCSFLRSTGSCLEELLSTEQIKRDAIFDPQAVAALVRKFKSGSETSVGDNMALVGILSTELLLSRFIHRNDSSSLPLQPLQRESREPSAPGFSESGLGE
jgi:asparagine synthase (glutamine-hydrolysing)